MSASDHAVLGPSSAARWIHCPASVRLSEGIPDTPSRYAEEGTLAHERAELQAAHVFGLIDPGTYLDRLHDWHGRVDAAGFDAGAMTDHAIRYSDLLEQLAFEGGAGVAEPGGPPWPGCLLLLERRVQTGIPGCWGTADAILVFPRKLIVCDYKYGAGVPVSAYENPQTMLYGVGSLEEFGDLLGTTEQVGMFIFQPRVGDGNASGFTMDADDLRAWRDSIAPIAAEALAGSDRFGPSEKACRWCPVAATCRARADHAVAVDFGKPDTLSLEELGDLLSRLPQIKAWASDLEAYCLTKAQERGVTIPGWKVVLTTGRRTITAELAARARLDAAGWPASETTRPGTLRPLGELETLVGGKAALTEILGDALGKTEGRPTLAPESDRRADASPEAGAARDFA